MFGHGDGPEVISDLTCQGVEEDIAACRKLNYTERPCSRETEVGVSCGQSIVTYFNSNKSTLDKGKKKQNPG
jgi:hypothetical protein